MRLLVLRGDGIGPEITDATLHVLDIAARRFGLDVALEHETIGLASLAQHGTTLRDEVMTKARAADGILLAPLSTAEYPPQERGGINPSAHLRKHLDLYANLRPARTYDGLRQPLGTFDLVIARENTEGFYADRNMHDGNADILVTPDVAIALRKITRAASTRIAETGCRLARERRGHVVFVHKANVLRRSDGLFLEACRAVAARYPDVTADEIIIDAMSALLVRDPQRFDVIVTTNMYGDILSDLCGEMSGSLGIAGALNAGDAHAMAQATHGSAPDIAGQDRANPIALILSLAMLLDWHARRRAAPSYATTAAAIRSAVATAIAERATTRDLGGALGTGEAAKAIAQRLRS
jgi:3-isopropylmalate dehydrogenase